KVWSDGGWSDIVYVGRHELSENLHRVLTHTGCVDVTKDHSLLNADGDEVTVNDIDIGHELLHHEVPLPEDTPENHQFLNLCDKDVMSHEMDAVEEKKAFAHGLFFAEGTCGVYGALGSAKSGWAIYNS